mmetsp:Transcript_23263/g.58413  ORF Transcript_23263/g.58413 Transcript_23263/m.58413 type:complete len:188 (+) Transcript_23263:311-874(+)
MALHHRVGLSVQWLWFNGSTTGICSDSRARWVTRLPAWWCAGPGVVDANERLAPASLAGEWMAFDVGCLPLVDDLDGSGERPILAYFSSETRQAWAAPPAEPSERGISLWLPGNVGVSMSLTAGYSADDDDNPAGDNLGVGGVVFGLGWMARDGTWISLERDYSGEGVLREVRSSSACQGGWVGGAM